MPVIIFEDHAQTMHILASDTLTYTKCHSLHDALVDAIARQG